MSFRRVKLYSEKFAIIAIAATATLIFVISILSISWIIKEQELSYEEQYRKSLEAIVKVEKKITFSAEFLELQRWPYSNRTRVTPKVSKVVSKPMKLRLNDYIAVLNNVDGTSSPVMLRRLKNIFHHHASQQGLDHTKDVSIPNITLRTRKTIFPSYKRKYSLASVPVLDKL